MRELTKAEEQIMKILWRLEKSFVKEIISEMKDPKPAYNTVSTIIRILETKKFVGHEEFGNSHRYFPVVSKKEYSKFRMNEMVDGYFGNSAKQLVSFFTSNNKINIEEADELIKILEELKKQEK